MSVDRTKQAMARIEGALARIEAAAARPKPAPAEAPASVSQLVEKHESLRETVTATLRDLDELIARAEA
ncbi:hypothetical protein [Altererythrobacter sp. ZODW24]|uniref:hypothetical protein n=1 Tax=Altererythrobacter sp. ZODW24 TaxID=2185142 RepID=UPI0013B44065|nr:hypothetical protein [Altererythrobacter sp. ZODW24]